MNKKENVIECFKETNLFRLLEKIKKFTVDKDTETVLMYSRKCVEEILIILFKDTCGDKSDKHTIESLIEGIKNKDKELLSGKIRSTIEALRAKCNPAHHSKINDYNDDEIKPILYDLHVFIHWYLYTYEECEENKELNSSILWLKEGFVIKKNCPKCGEEVEEDWVFCPNCEEELDKKVYCINKSCKREVKAHWKKCPTCKTVFICNVCGGKINERDICTSCNKEYIQEEKIRESKKKKKLLLEYTIFPKIIDKVLDEKEREEIMIVGGNKGFSEDEINEMINQALTETESTIEDTEIIEKFKKRELIKEYSIYPKIKDKVLDKKEKEEIVGLAIEKGFSKDEISEIIDDSLLETGSILEISKEELLPIEDKKITTKVINKSAKPKHLYNEDNYVFVEGEVIDKNKKLLLKNSFVLKENITVENFIISIYPVSQKNLKV